VPRDYLIFTLDQLILFILKIINSLGVKGQITLSAVLVAMEM